jgi:hypothetical protein
MLNLLILAHGMGENKPGWSADILAKLDAVAKQYPAFQGENAEAFSKRVTPLEILYDDILSSYVDQWNNSSTELAKWAKDNGRDLRKLANWLSKPLPSDATGFFWTTVIDPLLYRGFRLVRDDVRAAVCDQLATGITAALANGASNVTVLAHSLGTAVLHDSLDMIARGYKGNTVLSAGKWQVNNIFMLADVCLLARKLVADIDYFNSFVRPQTAGSADATYCQFFVNVWHRFDPFVILAAFRPGTWGDGYIEIGPLEHFKNANVHGYMHYLDHPLVHVPLINAALGVDAAGEPAISAGDQAKLLATYPVKPLTTCLTEIERIKDKALAVGNATDLEEAIIAFSEFLATAKQAANDCKPLFSPDMFK